VPDPDIGSLRDVTPLRDAELARASVRDAASADDRRFIDVANAHGWQRSRYRLSTIENRSVTPGGRAFPRT